MFYAGCRWLCCSTRFNACSALRDKRRDGRSRGEGRAAAAEGDGDGGGEVTVKRGRARAARDIGCDEPVANHTIAPTSELGVDAKGARGHCLGWGPADGFPSHAARTHR